MKPFTDETALSWATRRCSLRECCRQEIIKKLREGQLPEQSIAPIITRLEEDGYLNEARYARAFVHDKLAYDHWGKMKIRAALRMKGIGNSDIEAALTDADDGTYREMMRNVLMAKFRTLDFNPEDEGETYKATQKLLRFAASKGFEADEVFRIIERLKNF